MAEAYWALDPGVPAGTGNSSAWWFLLSEERCREIGRLAGRLSRYFHPYTSAAIAGSAMVWKNVAADQKWREGAAPALYQQIRHWYELTIAAEDPTTLIGPYALLRNFRMVVRVLRAFWIQLVLTGLGAAALIAFADLLASPRGTSVAKGLLATAGITGFSVAGVSAKLKNQAQALLRAASPGRLHRPDRRRHHHRAAAAQGRPGTALQAPGEGSQDGAAAGDHPGHAELKPCCPATGVRASASRAAALGVRPLGGTGPLASGAAALVAATGDPALSQRGRGPRDGVTRAARPSGVPGVAPLG